MVHDNLNTLLSLTDRKILFVGIGNLLKMDDGVGVYISRQIKNCGNISSITAEVSIENYIGKINSLNPDTLILIDCVDLGLSPGSVRVLRADQTEDLTFNTHNISLKHISEFFTMPVFILGIQPEKVGFGENISYIVRDKADKIINQINLQEVKYGC